MLPVRGVLIGYDFHLGAGNNGNVFGITNSKDTTHGRDQTFTYDALNRLTSAQNAGTNCATMVLQNKTEYWGNSYSYDAWGNLLQKTVTKCGAESLTVTADTHNWIHAPAPDYLYDAAGNMTFNATPPTQNYTYDQENRLTGAAGYTYTYDGDGNRVRKSNGTLAANGTLYWEMSPGVVAETDLAGTLKSEYVFFDGERVARRDGVNGAGGVFYYFSDHLKTASVITDSAGVIKAESDYYPWGGELQFVNNDSNDYKFTGKKRDTETGLDYFGARYYSNGLGRWVSADWSATPVPVPYADFGDPQSLNLYGYVRNIPTVRFDLDGHENLKPQDWPSDKPTTAPQPTQSPKAANSSDNQAQPKKDQFTVTVNNRQANIPGGQVGHAVGLDHQWITTSDGQSAGMGPAKNGGQVPGGTGESSPDKPGDPTQVVDHHGEVPTSTKTYTNIDKPAINSYLKAGAPTGPWVPGLNDCNSWVSNAIINSTPQNMYSGGVVDGMPITVEHNMVIYADGSIHHAGEQQ
jgi:RHS repeat-associated protein